MTAECAGLVLAVIALAMIVALRLRPHLLPSRRATDGVGGDRRSRTGRGRSGHRFDHRAVVQCMRWLAIRRPTRRAPLRPEDVARWCDDLARRVRTGSSLAGALIASTNVAGALHAATVPIRHALERGIPVADSVRTPAAVAPHPMRTHRPELRAVTAPGQQHLALACSVIAAVAEVGGSAAPALDRVASALRLRAADRDDRATHAAQARLSAHVLTVLPLLMLSMLVLTDADVRSVVMGGIGATCVLTGATLNLAGWCWMRRVIGHAR